MVLRSSDVISTVSSFEDLYLEPKLCSALGAAGFATPSPVQQAALPTCLEGGDVVVQATSGTGKTVVISCTCLTQAVKSTAPANSVKVCSRVARTLPSATIPHISPNKYYKLFLTACRVVNKSVVS